MSQITINDVILKFKDSSFTGNQWEQVASWVLNGGGEAAAESARIALNKAAEAVNAAANANRDANRSESYAVGGTGTREGEDTDNAKYYCEQAQRIAGGEFIASINGEGADETGNFTITATKVGAIDAEEKGAAGGVAELDGTGKVPAAQLPAAMTPAAHAESHKLGGSDPLTYADIDAAPAGYGYGGTTIQIGSNMDEAALEASLEEMFSAMESVSTKLITYTDSTGWRWFGILSKSSANNGSFVAHSAVYSGTKIIKPKYRGTWLPLEWENPPMLPGVEYRTIERWDDKPVYRKAVQYTNETALSGDSLYSIPHGISNIGRSYGVEIKCRTESYCIPYINQGESTAVTGCSATNIELRTTGNTNWSANRTWFFDMKFVKTE